MWGHIGTFLRLSFEFYRGRSTPYHGPVAHACWCVSGGAGLDNIVFLGVRVLFVRFKILYRVKVYWVPGKVM